MFSVEDLLISHGYKLSKNPTNLYENRSDGFQHEVTDRRISHGPLNGFSTNSVAFANSKKTGTKSTLNDNQSSYGIRGRQPVSVYHKDFPASANMHTSEAGFYDKPQLGWSSSPKTEKDLAYWRRRGQDFSALLGYTDKGDSEMKGMAVPCTLYGHDKKGQWEIEGGTEKIRRANMQENWKPSADYRWQNLRTESWDQPTVFGGLVSDIDKEKLLQDKYSGRQVSTAPTSHTKGKSQSLPRVLSPESLRCVEMPSLITKKHSFSGTKTVSCPRTGQGLETSRHPDLAAHFLPLPKPKYGRPLKPPSYELHQQTRGNLETNSLQDDLRKEEAISSSTKVSDPIQDVCTQDSSLEPPLYIPPPCYKSPAQQNTNQYLSSEVPDYDMCFNNGMQSPVEATNLGYPPSTGIFKSGCEHYQNEPIPYDKKSHLSQVEGYLSSVQYIPFDDPRIRHIKIAHPDGLQEDVRAAEDANRTSLYTFQGNSLESEYNSAFSNMPDSLNTAVKCDQVSGSSAQSSRWLAELNVDQDSCALPSQRDSYDAGNDLNSKCPKGWLSAQSPYAQPLCETVTKVKTFEPGTEIQSKRSSKKKMNETIFCLVSIPVKSDLNLPDTDRNNNLTQGGEEKNGLDNSGVLQEQSLLSTSSTDLELQALTGSMTNKNELRKQELWKPEFKQMNDLRFLQPAKHKELQYSGSWPGDQYKDQQTQTSFTEEPKVMRLFHGLEHTGSDMATASQLLRHGTSTAEPTLTVLAAANKKCKQFTSSMKDQGYQNKTSNSIYSRTLVDSPKVRPILPSASHTAFSGQEKETNSVFREEESTPCQSKELFGQFLLKPVSRRPWDIISELESFNKELQEQGESTEDGVENDGKQEREEEGKRGRKESGTFGIDEMCQESDQRPGMQPETVIPVAPICTQDKNKSKSESLSASEWSNTRVIASESHVDTRCLQAREMGEPIRAINGYLLAEQRKQEVGKRVIKHVVSLQSTKKIPDNSYDDENHYNPFNSFSFRKEIQLENDNVIDLDRLKKHTAPRNNLALERGSVLRLSLTNRSQGLSEPDLRSVGFDDDQGPGTHVLDCYGKPIVPEIPPNESLQARAARILGIEVPVDCLVPNNRTVHDKLSNIISDNLPQSPKLSAEKALGDVTAAKVTSYEGRRKCGWAESSFFVGDNISLESTEDQNPGQETLIAEHFEQHESVSKQSDDHIPPLESVVLPFAERHEIPPNAEKKGRGTSKVIETLQGKLAAPPNRAAMDRLVRMKEVHSVSRMRRLSIKNMDSSEDGDEDKQSKGSEERGSDPSSGHNELPRKLSHGSSVSKRIISLAENGLSDNRNEKKNGKHSFSLDVYDPTRVERV
ncbi:junctional protein associated with coronary artery disease [Sceloporus undulatus]|uniref:junctional protein associated with coronary artery disease n=1 Tax=Sceloporus undulatus TaxID=8520 RepID=UPI001C4BA260|nr:junctional protein associated with coronary artery disease [Sceloporus undulatus]XP_042331468.1 junctional protein associated with coronary artery disease [Sceloporus undulatus]XP_042331469.1 junctional protein associated with coronary artery disease [Sceloporus undulatus]XP_042331471.1 junctional protein associated with coronary artery disease [Sceloporus undulatus]